MGRTFSTHAIASFSAGSRIHDSNLRLSVNDSVTVCIMSFGLWICWPVS